MENKTNDHESRVESSFTIFLCAHCRLEMFPLSAASRIKVSNVKSLKGVISVHHPYVW